MIRNSFNKINNQFKARTLNTVMMLLMRNYIKSMPQWTNSNKHSNRNYKERLKKNCNRSKNNKLNLNNNNHKSKVYSKLTMMTKEQVLSMVMYLIMNMKNGLESKSRQKNNNFQKEVDPKHQPQPTNKYLNNYMKSKIEN